MQRNERAVMVVDDDPWLRAIVCEALEEEGYRVTAAGDGLEALRLVERSLPDLVLLDLAMPALDGRGFAAA
ncbi:MAG TPA: response regulator, partial [Planctomycetaceae bacterium]